MKLSILLIFPLLTIQGSSAFNWNPSVKKSGSTLYACSNDTVFFPYLYDLSESESIVSLEWTYHKNDVTKSIGSLYLKDFRTTRLYSNRVIININGNVTMKNVVIQDTGKYVLKIQIQNKDQSKQFYTKELALVVSEHAMYKGNDLLANISNKADWNPDTESFSSLTCGDFIFKNDNAPIDVEWITPDGSVKNSTKYSDGKFYLELDNPVKGGQYVCTIPKEFVSAVCAASNDKTQVTVNVNEDKARIVLLENKNKKLNEKLKAQNKTLNEKINNLIRSRIAFSCEDWKLFGNFKRRIYLTFDQSVELYCDQDTDGGRWNVFQRRRDGSVDFYRGWSDYRNGFGDPDKEFWLGLETLHQMTNNRRKYELRFDLEKQDGSKYYAVYGDFSIGSESEGYAVHYTGYRGNAGDAFYVQKDMKFTTKDRDQDMHKDRNCAIIYLGAWWYNKCLYTNLNGHYNDTRLAKGLTWYWLTGYFHSLKKTEMKFRVEK